MFPALMPPMATTGMDTDRLMLRSSSTPMARVIFLVLVSNTAPTPM